MRTEIEPWDAMPFYAQLAEILRGRIERGELEPRQPLPSELSLTQQYGVSRGTARRAVAILRDEGLIVTHPQRGSYVVPPEDRPQSS
jgi:DNA-binding GntR family transcriptional regulator